MLVALEAADTFELWPENLESLQLFLRLQSQWRYGPAQTAQPTGLDYAGVESALRMMRVKATADLFADLQTMEFEVLRLWRQ